jgi:hypothetical protein
MFCCVLFLSKKAELHAGVLLKKTHRHSGNCCPGKICAAKYQMLDCQRVHMICAASDLKRFAQGNIHEWTGNGPLPCMQGRAGVG